MRAFAVSFRDLRNENIREERRRQYLAAKPGKLRIFWTVYQFSSVRSLLVSFSVVGLMADARI